MPKKTFFNLPEEKRTQIIERAKEEFAQEPYQNISINRLIKCMQIPTGSFYQYFEDKKDLYFYILSFYMDSELEEAKKTNHRIHVLETDKNTIKDGEFVDTKNMKYYQEIFVDNFNLAPLELKRDWSFDKLMVGKYMDVYDYSFFEDESLDPKIKENKKLLMSIAIAFANVIHKFCKDGEEEEWKLYEFCINILRSGMKHYSEEADEVKK